MGYARDDAAGHLRAWSLMFALESSAGRWRNTTPGASSAAYAGKLTLADHSGLALIISLARVGSCAPSVRRRDFHTSLVRISCFLTLVDGSEYPFRDSTGPE
jgi:hypothetical protein